ncbi:hypothetical protein Tco_0151972 [Tanacetum coccineum]
MYQRTKKDWDFAVVQEPVVSTGTPSSMRIDQDTPSTSTSQTTQEEQSHVIPTSVEEDDHELHEFEHLEIWKLVPRPDQVMIVTLKWIYKVKLDELGECQAADIISKPQTEKLELAHEKGECKACLRKMMKSMADETEELRRNLLDHKIQQLSKGSSEGSGITPEVPDEPKDNSVGFNLLVHSFRALSTLRRSGLRTASAAAKPCQGDSSEVYLITGRIPTVAAAGQRHVNSQPHAHTSYF